MQPPEKVAEPITLRSVVLSDGAHPRALRPRRAPPQDPVRRSRGLSMRRQRMRLIILIIIILLLVGALPTWPYSSGWGYYPSGGLGLVLVIVLILVLLGRL